MMINTKDLLSKASEMNIAVIGDFILDRYILGNVERISPEAPVVILNERNVIYSPGGAGNVYENLISLGAGVDLFCSATDPFQTAKFLERDKGGIHIHPNGNAIKTRVMSDGHHIVRIDKEQDSDQILWPTYRDVEWRQDFELLLPEMHCVILSDYGKGMLSDSIIYSVIALCVNAGVPVVVDSKKNFERFRGAKVLKCNAKESMQIPGRREDAMHLYGIEYLVVTNGADGIDINGHNIDLAIPGHQIFVSDVCGAGDTVTAILGLGIAQGMKIEDICEIANFAGAEVCTHPGVYAIKPEDLV